MRDPGSLGPCGGAGGEGKPRGCGVATLSPHLVAGEGGFGWDVPCSDPGRGNRGRGRGAGAGPAGPARLAAGQGVGRWPCGWVGLPGPGGSPLPFFFFFCNLFLLFISLSVLFNFRAFRHFIKWCLLHHNYQCNIWQPPNIFALPFENLGCLSLIHILNCNDFELPPD